MTVLIYLQWYIRSFNHCPYSVAMNLHVFYPILIILPYCTPNTFEIFSTTPNYFGIRPHQLRYGRFFCSLSPVGHKTYYGVNRGNIDQARRCCISKNLTLFDLPSRWKSAKLEILRKDLIRSTFIIPPIGRDDQIYVNVAGYGPPWCSAVYFSSTTKIILRVVGTDCTGPYNYLCEDKTTYPVCSKKNFKRIGPDKLFSKVKLPWREAFECCEDRGQHLMSLPYLKIKDMPDIIKELENETYFWTGGSSKFGSFEWKWATNLLIDREYELNTEFCIVAHVSSGSEVKIMDYPCENAFQFVCENLDSNPCFYGEWDEIHIDYKGAKRYLYTPDTFANFNDARDCCLANDYTLFTSIVPSDGLMIAEYLTKNETLRFEFQGLASGTWVGARLQGNKRARMLNTKGHAEFPMKGNYPDNYLEGNTGCFTFSLDMRNLFLYQDEECLRKRPFLCEMSTERENNVYSYYDAGSRYYYKDHKTVQRLAKHECMKKEMSLYAPDFGPDFKFVVTGAGQFERLAEPAQKGFWVGYIRFNPPVYLNEFFYQRVPTPDLVDHMIEDDKMEATGEYCNLANVINGQLVVRPAKCREKAHYLCEDTNITKVMGCSEFFIVHDVYFSITPSNWFDARACCKRLGNWSHKFDLVNIENHTLVDYQLEYVMLAYQTFNHGFWTSGSNYGGRSRLFWYTGHYPLITDSSIFYQRYMDAYDPLPEDDQCIQGHFDEDRNKFQFSHSNCYNMKKFMCVRTPWKQKAKWPLDCESVGYRQLNTSNYFVALHAMPFARAAECCRRRQAVMLTIDSAMLNDHLYQLITKEEGITYDSPTKLKWIGLTRNPVNQQFSRLRDGKILRRGRDFSNFDNKTDLHFMDTYYPDQEITQSCVAVYAQDEPGIKKLFWRPLPCTMRLSSLCYRRMWPDDVDVMRRGIIPLVRKTWTPAFDEMIRKLDIPRKFAVYYPDGSYKRPRWWWYL